MKTVTLDEIAARVSSRLRQDVGQVRRTLTSSVEIIREEVRDGNRVALPQLITIDRNLPGVELDAMGPAAEPVSAKEVLLAVPQKDFFTNVIAQRLTNDHTQVRVAEGIEGARQSMNGQSLNLLVLDASMEGVLGFVRDIKTARQNNAISIVAFYNEGADPKELVGLRIFEDEAIVEPFDLDDLVRMVESELHRAAEEKQYFDHQLHIELPTTEASLDEGNDLVSGLLAQTRMDDERQATLAVAFKEALDNSARHGNRYQAARRIKVVYLVDASKVTITVEDEGEGFDTELYLTRGVEGDAVAVARERHQAGRVGGLGIMLMLKCVDNLEYNYAGSLVKLTRNIEPS